MRDDPADAQKNELKPWQKKGWCIPPEQNAAFVCAMEDVLEVYSRPYDPARPQVCLDEAAKQILSEVREPLPMQPGQPERVDNEYQREGTCALFMLFEPLSGKRSVLVRDRRTAKDFAEVVHLLCDEMYPEAERIVLVLDNLNTHGAHSLYERYEAATARRLAEKIEWHFTPKHGSWLNIAQGAPGDRVVGAFDAVSGGTDGQPRPIGAGGFGMGGCSQRRLGAGGLAFHDGGGAQQAQAPLPIHANELRH